MSYGEAASRLLLFQGPCQLLESWLLGFGLFFVFVLGFGLVFFFAICSNSLLGVYMF